MKKTLTTLAFAFFLIIKSGFFLTAQSTQSIQVKDRLSPLPGGSVSISGHLGKKLNDCIVNGVMSKDYELYVAPFRERFDDPQGWAGEFWGKWFTSAALAYNYQPTSKHRAIIDGAVDGLLKTQDSNGRMSSYTKSFGPWDMWGRKYAMLGLIAYYDQTGDTKALQAAADALDELILVAGPGKQKLTETGLSLLEGLSSMSILEPIVQIYNRTGEKRFLDFAEYHVSLWSLPNEYNEKGQRLVEDAIAGVPAIQISSPKSYEQMSCYEGLCELYRATGDKKYLDAVLTYAKNVLDKEIMIVGSGSSGELWCDGAIRQTELLEKPLETCVTATWIKFCYQLLRLTGDPKWADQMEITLYNALIGAMIDDAKWWSYYSPLAGERIPSHLQVPVCQSSCCVASGPRGLLTAPGWSVMKGSEGPVVNIYAQGKWDYTLDDGKRIELIQQTDYPKSGEVEITMKQQESAQYTLSLRIPEWSEATSVRINDDELFVNASGYFDIKREWKDGDRVFISLDMRGRMYTAPGNRNQLAIMRGPIVLTLDNRLIDPEKDDYASLYLLHDHYTWKYDKAWTIDYALLQPVPSFQGNAYIDLKPIETGDDDIYMAFEVPFLYRPTHFVRHTKTSLVMCDYASAGNRYTADNLYRVWMPQPMFFHEMFPKNSWLIHTAGKKERPEVPSLE